MRFEAVCMRGRSLLWDTTGGSTPLSSTRQFWPLFTLLLPNFLGQRAETWLSNRASTGATIFISPSPTLRRCCSNSTQRNMSGSGVGGEMACRCLIPRNSCHTFQCPPRWTLPFSPSGLDYLQFPSPEPGVVTHPPHVVTALMKSQTSEARAILSECPAMCLLWSWYALSFLLAGLWPQRFKLPLTCPPIALNAGNFINHYFLDENTEQREVKSFPLCQTPSRCRWESDGTTASAVH